MSTMTNALNDKDRAGTKDQREWWGCCVRPRNLRVSEVDVKMM